VGRHGLGSWDTITRGARTYARFRITIDGRTLERTGPSRRALEREAEALRKRARQRLVSADEEITLATWALDRWLPAKALELGEAGAKTIRNYRSVLERHVVPALGTVKVRDLRAEHRRRLQRALVARGLKASTVNVVDGVLRACLQAAAHDELPVVVSAIAAVKPVKAAPERKRTLSAAEVARILALRERGGAALSVASPWSCLWACFAYTGARDAEVRALRWSDLADGVLTIRRQLPQQPGDPPRWQEWIKGRRIERVVPVVPALAAALREHRARQAAARLGLGGMWCPYDLIFPDEVGRALGAQRVNRQFAGACLDAGVAVWKGLGVHALRHAANNLLRAAGVDAPLRAQILGHSQAVNERTYTAESLALAAEALGRMAETLAG
jgi:integrase